MNIFEKISNLHFDIHQLKLSILYDLNIDNYIVPSPSFYDYMEYYEGQWEIEQINDINFFNPLEPELHMEEDYSYVKNIMIGQKYIYLQNKENYWLVINKDKGIIK